MAWSAWDGSVTGARGSSKAWTFPLMPRVNATSMIAVLRDDLSYRASQFAQELPKTRYFNMTIARLRPFTDMRFAELGKQIIAANEKANIDLPTAIYQVVSGGPTGMYLIFQPMKSMETMDSVPAERSHDAGDGDGQNNCAL